MSSPTPLRSKGRGRGRKELTPNERVAQWVNQREAKKLSKERWSNRSPSGSSVTEEGDNQNVVEAHVKNESSELDSSLDRSSKIKRPVVQVYVPPSLRGKKISGNNADTGSQSTVDQDRLGASHLQDFTKIEEYNVSGATQDFIKAVGKDKQENTEDVSKPKGRGRGRRKPEMEIYVPRALRGSKQEVAGGDRSLVTPEKTKVSTTTRERDKDSQREIGKEKNKSKIIESSPELSSRQSSDYNTTNSVQSEVPVNNFISSTADTWTEHASAVPYNSSCLSGDAKTKVNDQHQNQSESFLTVDVSSNDRVLSSECVNDSFTFEFYDPAVIAFLPSPPVLSQSCNQDNSAYFRGDFYSSPSTHSQNASELSDTTGHFPNVCSLQQSLGVVDNESNLQQSSAIDSSMMNNQILQNYPDQIFEDKELLEKYCNNPLNTKGGNEDLHSYSRATCHVGEQNESRESSSKESQMILENDTSFHKDKSEDIENFPSNSHPPCNIEEEKTNEIINQQEHVGLASEQQLDYPSNQQKSTCKSFVQADQQELINNTNRQEPKQSEGPLNDAGEEDGGDMDSWDTLFDDNGDCLDENLMEELTEYVGKVEVDKPKINYLKYEPKEPELDFQAFGHIVEIYDFSPELATCDIMTAFKDFTSRGFDVKWVDDTHALGIFSSAVAAKDALRMIHPLLRVRPMSEASKKGQSKARHCQEFLQPYKARPQTTSMAARRLVAGALGMAPRVSKEIREQERKKLKEAKEKRRQERQQKVDIWDGSFGKCAMDENDTGSR